MPDAHIHCNFSGFLFAFVCTMRSVHPGGGGGKIWEMKCMEVGVGGG